MKTVIKRTSDTARPYFKAIFSSFALACVAALVLVILRATGNVEFMVTQKQQRTYRPVPKRDRAPKSNNYKIPGETKTQLYDIALKPRPEVSMKNALTTTAAPGGSPNHNNPPYYNQKGQFVNMQEPINVNDKHPGEGNPYTCSVLDFKTTYLRESKPGSVCPSGQEKIGFLCYRKCPHGWFENDAFPNTCSRCRDYSSTCDFLSMIHTGKVKTGVATECESGYTKWAGLCYKLCDGGYKAQGNICVKCVN